MRTHLPLAVALLLVSCNLTQAVETTGPKARPNIVFIMADDLGYTDVACFGSKYYETPNIDEKMPNNYLRMGHEFAFS